MLNLIITGYVKFFTGLNEELSEEDMKKYTLSVYDEVWSDLNDRVDDMDSFATNLYDLDDRLDKPMETPEYDSFIEYLNGICREKYNDNSLRIEKCSFTEYDGGWDYYATVNIDLEKAYREFKAK